ncbi:hypothetical protein VTN31DRAFT_507 [Thermomyces dupontii]|uniref:uncharacterized protein n=1 Tax=Talaromyces thermophilus TaxID=28565 RepID=UPI00374350E1
MTPWVFDRSGCHSPGQFNIHTEPERFIRLIVGYTMMDKEELGLDTFMERDGDRRFIRVKHEGTEMKLQLELEPLTRQRAIVCRGTSCFLTKAPDSEDWDHVAKFSWTSLRRIPRPIFSNWRSREKLKASPDWSVIAPSPASRTCVQALRLRGRTLSVVHPAPLRRFPSPSRPVFDRSASSTA